MGKAIIFYRTADGKCPVQEFFDSLSGKAAQKLAWVLSLIEDLDVVPSTFLKKLVGNKEIWECRLQFGSNAYRVFCFFDGNSVVVLTHGMTKKTQKIPQREINKAEAYRRDYLQRRIEE